MLKKLLTGFRVKEVRKQWELTREKLSVLEEQYIIETRGEERFRIEKLISQLKEERQLLEQELLQIEAQLGEALFSPTEGVASDGQDTPQWPATPWWVSLFTGRKLRYIVLLLIIGGGAWGTVNLLPNPDPEPVQPTQTIGKASERRILQLEPEYERLRTDFERIDKYPKVSSTIKNEAPFLAEKFLAVPEDGMKSPYRLAKYQYAAYSFMVAASVENDPDKVNLYLEKGIDSGERSIAVVDEIKKKSIEGDYYEDNVYRLMQSDYGDDQIKYNLAILYIMRYRRISNNNDSSKAGQLLSSLSDGYKEDFPITGNKYINWYLEQQLKEDSE